MAASPSKILRMSGETAREYWLCDGGESCKPLTRPHDGPGGIMAVDCVSLDSAPFWTTAMAEAGMDLDAMVALHWEAMGVNTTAEGRNFLYWRVDAEEGRVLVGTLALAAEVPEEEWVAARPDSFEVSVHLLPLPPAEYVLWQEMGRYVVAFTRGSLLLHVAVLNARKLDDEAALELRDLTLSLDARSMTGKCKGWRIWTHAENDFIEALKTATGVKVRQEPRPAPRLPKEPSDLLPACIALMREERERRAQFVRLIATLAIVCFTFFATWAGYLTYRSIQADKAIADQQHQAPEVQAVRHARQHWNAVEAATNPDASPVEVFYQVWSLLPDEGIQLKEFLLDERKLTINGLASSVNHAIQLKAALEGNEALKRYRWHIDQPTFQADNRANFHAEGILIEGGESEASEGE